MGREEPFPNLTSRAESCVGKGAFCFFSGPQPSALGKTSLFLEQLIMNPKEVHRPFFPFFYVDALILDPI